MFKSFQKKILMNKKKKKQGIKKKSSYLKKRLGTEKTKTSVPPEKKITIVRK